MARGEVSWEVLCFLFEMVTETGKHRKFQSRKLTDSKLSQGASATENALVVGPLSTVTEQYVSLKQHRASLPAL